MSSFRLLVRIRFCSIAPVELLLIFHHRSIQQRSVTSDEGSELPTLKKAGTLARTSLDESEVFVVAFVYRDFASF